MSTDYTRTAEDKLTAIIVSMQKHRICFSKAEAVKLLGGTPRFNRLVERGLVRVERKSDAPNGKCFVNGADVLNNCIPY